MYVLISKHVVRSGIRTHAHRSGLRPERSALDLSAILTRAVSMPGPPTTQGGKHSIKRVFL